RLTESTCCLITPEGEVSNELQRIMRLTNKDFQEGPKIMELNPRSPLIERLARLSSNSEHDEFIRQCAAQFYDNARLLDGNVPDPKTMVDRVENLIREIAEKRSPIIT